MKESISPPSQALSVLSVSEIPSSSLSLESHPGDHQVLPSISEIPFSAQSLESHPADHQVLPSIWEEPYPSVSLESPSADSLHQVLPYFEIRKSPKGGYGAFALQDISAYTNILTESPLLQSCNETLFDDFEKLTEEQKAAYMKLACYDDIAPDKRMAIFKTNRSVNISHFSNITFPILTIQFTDFAPPAATMVSSLLPAASTTPAIQTSNTIITPTSANLFSAPRTSLLKVRKSQYHMVRILLASTSTTVFCATAVIAHILRRRSRSGGLNGKGS